MESGGGDANYWPGFVDALSNVVLTLVFVLVIFVFALVMASNKVEQKMQEVVSEKKEHDKKVSASKATFEEVAQLRKELSDAKAKLRAFEEKDIGKSAKEDTGSMDQVSQSDALEDKKIIIQQKDKERAEGASATVEKNKNRITLVFPENVTDLDDKSAAELTDSLKITDDKIKSSKIVIRSILGSESYSVAERLAYYRALAIRNYIIQNKGISPNQITSSIIKPDNPGEGRVEILFNEQ